MLYFYSLVNIAIIYGALAVFQGILLNRLKLAFAGATVIAGLTAYILAANASGGNVGLVGMLLVVSIWLLLWFQDRLVGDFYLVASIALLELINAVASAPASGLGGREGLVVPRLEVFSDTVFEQAFLWITIPLMVLSITFYWYLFRTNLGVFIDRIGVLGEEANRWVNAKWLRHFVILMCMACFSGIGAVYLFYRGGISPSIFSIDMAFLVIIFTVLSMRYSALGMLVALLYFTLPWIVTRFSEGLQISQLLPWITGDAIAELVRLTWGVAVIVAARNISIDGRLAGKR